LFKLTLRNIRGRKLRYALTTFAVVLGVAFLSTSFFLTDRIRETFDDLALDIVGEADLAVRASFGDGDRRNQLPIPAELTRVVTSDIPGVATVEASIIAFGVVPLYVEDGKPQAVASAGAAPGLGFNFNGVDGFNNIWVVKGRAPEHVASPDGEEVVGEFALATNVAEDHNFAIGEIYTISAPSGNRDFTLVGLVHWGSADKNKAVWATVTVFDNWTAQEFLNRQGRYDSLSVLLEPEADRAEVATLIQAEIDAAVAEFKLMVWLLPEEEQQAYTALDSIELEVVTSDVLVEENKSDFDLFLSIFSTVLLVFAVIAVLVSAFIINNTFTIVIGQRIRELGLLRSLGATGRQISRSVRIEALIIGAVATVVGLISGYLLATLLSWVLSNYGFGNILGGIPVRPRTVLAATVVGVGSTLLSSLGPSNKVRSITPVEALREGAGFTPTGMTRRLLVGSGVTMVGVALLAVGMLTNLGTRSLLTALGAGALVTFLGVYLLSPVIARPVVNLLGRPLQRIFKIPGRLARENAGRSPRRTAATAAALTVGLALVSLAAVVGDSAKATVNQILDDSIEADLFVRGPTDITGFSNELNERIRDVAEQRPDLIESSIGYRFGFSAIEVEGSRKAVASADLDTLSGHMDLGLVEGDPDRYGSDGLLVHVDPATDLGLKIGTQLTVGFQGGQETVLTVAAIFEDAALLGNWVVDNSTIKEHLPQTQDVFVSVLYPPGADQAVSRAAVEAVAADYPQASMEDRDEFRENMSARLDRVLVVITVLLALSLLIAVLGITNTLALSVYERTRELGLLRAIGMTRRQLRRMVRWEAVIIALFGGILGLAIGVLFGIAAIAAMPEAFIRVTSVPTMTLLVYLGVAGLFGVAAAIFPARRAARLDILKAISYE